MTVYIGICTLGRPEGLEKCLAAVAAADTVLGEEVAVLVVDNGPDAVTRAACDRAATLPGLPPLHYVAEEKRGISFARNRAVAEALARGADCLAFIDDDDVPESGWLRELVQTQRASGADLVLGRWVIAQAQPIPSWAEDIGFLRLVQFGRLNRYGVPSGAGTGNVLLTRALLESLAAHGPVFSPQFARCGGEDTEFFIRTHRLGFRNEIAHESRIVRGWDADRLTLNGVLRRSFRLGHSFALIRALHAPEGAGSLRKALWRTSRLVLGLPLRLWPPSRLVNRLSRIAREAGGIHARLGRDLEYYGRNDLDGMG